VCGTKTIKSFWVVSHALQQLTAQLQRKEVQSKLQLPNSLDKQASGFATSTVFRHHHLQLAHRSC